VSHLQTLLEVSDVRLLRLQQLRHDEPEEEEEEEEFRLSLSFSLSLPHSLFLPGRLPLLLVDLGVGVTQLDLGVVRQAGRDDVQLQVLIALQGKGGVSEPGVKRGIDQSGRCALTS